MREVSRHEAPRYIPAFHFRWLTLWYDPMMRYLFPEEALKTALIAQARIQSGQNVLDMGCGTGTLTLLIKQIKTPIKYILFSELRQHCDALCKFGDSHQIMKKIAKTV